MGGEPERVAANAGRARERSAAHCLDERLRERRRHEARHALALTRLGRPSEAGPLVHRALALLDRQRHLEGSVEEVLVQCATVLRATGASEHAAVVRARARASAIAKHAGLVDPAWRAAFAALPWNAELLS